MAELLKYSELPIDWDLTPEEAVTLYLEWGNNNWHGAHSPVRSKSDFSVYFVVDTWGEKPKAVLIKRNSEDTEELLQMPLPEYVAKAYEIEGGKTRGVSAPTETVKAWLRHEMGYAGN
ncbi:MAG: hypothetical protein HZB23_04375 [Deltaproteobacteria bacterium]|nr:hypothetical protein [Deltaproteobacteria bacterium]